MSYPVDKFAEMLPHRREKEKAAMSHALTVDADGAINRDASKCTQRLPSAHSGWLTAAPCQLTHVC